MLPLATTNVWLEGAFHERDFPEEKVRSASKVTEESSRLSKVPRRVGPGPCIAKHCLAANPRPRRPNPVAPPTIMSLSTTVLEHAGWPSQSGTARFVVLVGPRRPSIYSPPAGWSVFTSLGSGHPRRDGWTEAVTPPGTPFSTVVDRPVEKAGGARGVHGGRKWRHIPRPSGSSFAARCADASTPVTWQTWLASLEPYAIEGGVVSLRAPSEFHLRWVNDKFRPIMEEAVTSVFGPEARLVLDARSAPLAPEAEDLEEENEPEPEEEPPHPGRGLPLAPPPRTAWSPSTASRTSSSAPPTASPTPRPSPSPSSPGAVQPAVHLRRCRPGQDPPPAGDRPGTSWSSTHVWPSATPTSEAFFNDFIDGIRRKRMDEFKARLPGAWTSCCSTTCSSLKARSSCSESSSTPSMPCTSTASSSSSAATGPRAAW